MCPFQLRNHLNNAIKHQGQPNTVNLTNPETLQLHLETRLAQLESAINMELWQVCVEHCFFASHVIYKYLLPRKS